MISINQDALNKIEEIRKETKNEYLYLKILLKEGTCGKYAYSIDLSMDPESDEMFVIVNDEPEEMIIMNKLTYDLLNHSTLKYTNNQFLFEVPNSKSCSCGLNFNLEE